MATDLHTAANRLLKAWDLNDLIHEHIEALRQALANEALDKMAENARELGLDYEPAQQEPFGYFKAEPFGWTDCAESDEGAVALYERPQPAQRTWVGLTKQEFNECVDGLEDLEDCWTAIEAKLKEKNT